MPTRIHIAAVLLVPAFVVFIHNLVTGDSGLSLGLFSTSVTVLVIVFALYDRWLWRIGWLQGWFVNRPHLWGTWRVTLRSSWVDPATGAATPPIEGYVAVRQTNWSISIRLMTAKSSGDLMTAELTRKDDGSFRLCGVYLNEPHVSERDRSPIHYGAFKLDVEGKPNGPDRLFGHYWTDRDTKGEMELSGRTTDLYDSFSTAKAGLSA